MRDESKSKSKVSPKETPTDMSTVLVDDQPYIGLGDMIRYLEIEKDNYEGMTGALISAFCVKLISSLELFSEGVIKAHTKDKSI